MAALRCNDAFTTGDSRFIVGKCNIILRRAFFLIDSSTTRPLPAFRARETRLAVVSASCLGLSVRDDEETLIRAAIRRA